VGKGATPSLHDEKIRKSIPKDIANHIDNLYNSGRYYLVDTYIKKVAEEQDIECLKGYLEEKEKFHKCDGNVITTHRKLLHMDEETLSKFDVIIIDEDIILKSIIPNQMDIPRSDLDSIIKIARKDLKEERITIKTFNQLCKKVMDVRKSIKTKTLLKVDNFDYEIKEKYGKDKKEPPDGTPTPIDVPSFCLASHFYFRKASDEKNLDEDTITFLKPLKLKEGFKYIILSATASEDVCKHYFGEDNIIFHNCKQHQYRGNLYQIYDKPFSRDYIDKYNNQHGNIFSDIKKRYGIEHILTFKRFAERYNLGSLWYGNNEGSNIYEGKDLCVVGTPHALEFKYKLFAYTLGLDFDEDAQLKHNLPVTHNGYRFRFTTYEDEILRSIQFWIIESELEQAVGRARLLRHDCTVYLFSNFPVQQAVMRVSEHEKTKDIA